MVCGKPLSVETRSAIVTLHREEYSVRNIGEKFKICKSTVHLTIRRYKDTESLQDRIRPGSSRSTSNADDKQIMLMSKRNRKMTAPEITVDFNQGREKPITVSTVKRRLQEADLHGRIAIKKTIATTWKLAETTSMGKGPS
ncbi:uncharacterized protein LOC143174692 [Nomia melanderi]|uniref:uncharacterized protein LOC143174692 n=1 Tax=Nomia melanderi TaxID=2448451 RepID=UPI003FCD0B9E